MALLISHSRFTTPKIILFAMTLILTACQQSTLDVNAVQTEDDLGKIIIGDKRVTVEPKHIAHIKSERYQPSLSLYGKLQPSQQAIISTPQRLKLLQIAVKEGDKVEQGDVLLSALPAPKYQTPFNNDEITITAPIAGTVRNLAFQDKEIINNFFPTFAEANTNILTINNEEDWQFISYLPQYSKKKLSIGQHVNFAFVSDKKAKKEKILNNKDEKTTKLTGQISDIQPRPNKEISVTVHIASSETPDIRFQEGMQVQGKVDFGQIEVGTLVAKTGVHPILTHEKYGGLATDLSVFTQPHAHVVAPVKAYVWIVNQDRTLKKQLVDVIRYHPQSEQYVVAGIPNEVLICLADLPDEVEGRLAHIS